MAAALSPEKLLRELADLWTATGREGPGDGSAGVLRACTMTLIVIAEQSDDQAALGETIAALMPEHPSRTILIRLSPGAEPILAERVYAQCWMPFGQRRQICCEQVEITASDGSLADLPSLLLPLAAPDLPVILWSRSPRLFEMPEFAPLASIAGKVIVDSILFPDPNAALARMADMAQHGATLGDLSWTQLTRWREMLSRVFENREYLAQVPRISRVEVCHAGARPPVYAWYMGAWAVSALSEAGVHAELKLTPDPALEARRLRVELAGGDFRVALERQADRISIEVGGLSSFSHMPQPSDYILLREELGIVRHDPVFERTLATAARLAASSPA
jgi:glucose-6-phosphate dehydrogenase assembly protein OpcA